MRLRIKDITTKVGSGITPRGGAETYLEHGIPLFRSQNVHNNGFLYDDIAYISDEVDEIMSNTRVKAGDVLLNITGASIGRCFYTPEDFECGNVNQHVCIIRPKNHIVKSAYLHFCIISDEGQEQIKFMQTGANRDGLAVEDIKSFSFDIPSLQVQQRIVEYLDAKTTVIDNKIELLGKKRDAYNCLKTATINRAVTRGLDERVKLKDSGMDWIGQIPEHWDVKRTKDVCSSIFTGATPSTTNDEYWDGDIPWIPSGCCHDCYIKEAPKFITQEGFANSSTRWIPSGTTVMAITGATCAQLGILKIDACANQSVVAFIENKKKLDARYLFYVLRSERGIILTNRTGGAQAGVDTGDCMKILICVPPLSEQKQIAAYLDDRCAKIDAAVTIIDKQIDALKRLKRSLINEVVTGKRMV